MNQTTIQVLQKAAELGLKLGREAPDILTIEPVAACPLDFASALRSCKPQLLALLQLPFVMAYSKTLEETVFFCQDEATKAALVAAGAEEWSIYTKDELRTLSEQNRVAPLSPAELRKVHEIKQAFDGRISS